MGTWLPAEFFVCNPKFLVITEILVGMMNELETYEAAHKIVEEETVECEPDDTDYDNLMSTLLRSMGAISLIFPFDRAVYPLPSGDAIEFPLTGT